MSATPGAPWPGADPESLVGQVFAERFRLVRLLGTGGMGAVYEATQLNLQRRVAVKVLNPQLARDKTHVERFRREAQAASNLKHRNIVDVIDFGESGDLVFYAMEFLEGEDLAALLKRVSRLDWADARRLLLQIVRGLRAAHAKGVIHRDIKPANIYLVPDEDRVPCVKLLDFGIAKMLNVGDGNTLTRSDELFGSVKYMAPEQADGRSVDARTDVYSVGVVAYRMLTGRVPFDDDNAFRVLTRHQVEPPASLRSLVPEVTESVEALVLRALKKAPADRFDSMDSFEAAVLEIDSLGQRGSAVTVRPVTEPPPVAARDGTAILPRTEFAPASEATEILAPPSYSTHAPPPRAARPMPGPAAPEPPPLLERSGTLEVASAPVSAREPPTPRAAAEAASTSARSRPNLHRSDISRDGTLFEVRRARPVWLFVVLGTMFVGLIGLAVYLGGVLDAQHEPADKAAVKLPAAKASAKDVEPIAGPAGPNLTPATIPTPEPVATPDPAPPSPVPTPAVVEPTPTPAPAPVKPKPPKPPKPDGGTKPPAPDPVVPKPAAGPSDASLLDEIRKAARAQCSGTAGETVVVKIQVRQSGGALYAIPQDPHKHTALGKCVAQRAKSDKFSGTGSNRSLSVEVAF